MTRMTSLLFLCDGGVESMRDGELEVWLEFEESGEAVSQRAATSPRGRLAVADNIHERLRFGAMIAHLAVRLLRN